MGDNTVQPQPTGIKLQKVAVTPSLVKPEASTANGEIEFSLSQSAADKFISSKILNGEALDTDGNNFDYLGKGYIGWGDIVSIKKTPNNENSNDWIVVFKDRANLKSLVWYDKAVTGLRIFFDKENNMHIIGLKKPEIEHRLWGNGKNEEELVFDTLRAFDKTKNISEDDFEKDNNVVSIYDSSKPEQNEKFKTVVNLFIKQFDGSYSDYKGFGCNTGNAEAFKGVLKELFFNLETKIKASSDFNEQKKLLNEYAKIYHSVERGLETNESKNLRREVSEIIFGDKSFKESKSPLDKLIEEVAIDMKAQLVEKLRKNEIKDIDLAFKEIQSFLRDLRSDLSIDSTDESINASHAKVLLDLVQDYLGTSLDDLTNFNDKVIKLLDSKDSNVSIKEILQEVKLKAFDKLDKDKFTELTDTKGISKLMEDLGLGKINSATTKVFQLKGLTSFLIIESIAEDKFKIRALDICDKGVIKTSDFDNKSYKEVIDLVNKSKDAVYNNFDLNSKHKLAVVEFLRDGKYEEVLDKAQKGYLSEFTSKDIKDKDDADLVASLLGNAKPEDINKVKKAFFDIAEDKKLSSLKQSQVVLKALKAYLKDPSQANKDALQKDAMPKEIQSLAATLSADPIYFLGEKSKLETTINSYNDSRNKTVTNLVTDLTCSLVKLKGTTKYTDFETEFDKSLKSVLKEIGIEGRSEEPIKTALKKLIGTQTGNLNVSVIKDEVSRILSSNLQQVSVMPVAFTPTNLDSISKLRQDLITIASENSIASTADISQIKDFIYLLKNGRKLHPIQLNIMDSILKKYSTSSSEYINNGFEELVNEDLIKAIKDSDVKAWGFSHEDMQLESIISKLSKKYQNLKVSVEDYKFMLNSINQNSIKLDKTQSEGLVEEIKKQVGDKPRLIAQVVKRLVLRNSLPTTINNDGVTEINLYPELKNPSSFDLEHFVQTVRGNPDLAKSFLEEMSSFEGSIDRLDAIRQYELARILAIKDFDYTPLIPLKPEEKGYEDRLTIMASNSRDLWIKEKFLGCQRSSFNGDTVNKVEFKVAEQELQDIFLKNTKATLNNGLITNLENYDKALQILKAIDYTYSYISEDGSIIEAKVHDKESLIELLNVNQKIGNSPASLVTGFTSKVNSTLASYQTIDQNSYDSYEEKDALLESAKSLFSIFGRNKIVKEIPGQYEAVNIDEVIYSFAALMKKIEEFKNKYPEQFKKAEFIPGQAAPMATLSPQSFDYFNLDLEEVNKEHKKKKVSKLSYFSTNRNIA